MERALAQIAEAGFDVAHAFDAEALAAAVPQLAGPERLGLLIGNTRALWPPFVAALRDDELARDPDPLERYTERVIGGAFPAARIYYSHRRYAPVLSGDAGEPAAPAFLPFQRIAVATGLGALAPSHLVIHPIHGPWFALRAIVLVDGSPPVRAPIAQPCRCDAGCASALARATTHPGDRAAWLAVRDACSLSSARYPDEQIRYHYGHVWPRR